MFEAVYGTPERTVGRALADGRTLVSVAIHAAALVALSVSGVSPVQVTEQVTEGIVFLAPPPVPMAAPDATVERLTFTEIGDFVSPIADLVPDAVVLATPVEAPALRTVSSAGGDTLQRTSAEVETRADSVYFAEEVDSPAAYDASSAAPAYPDSLQRAGIGGSVVAQFVVDTGGRVEVESFILLQSTDKLFTQSVRDALPKMLFRPAVLNGRKARQLVEIPFRFRVVPRDSLKRDTTKPPPPLY